MPRSSPFFALLAASTAVAALAVGCDRFTYWSSTAEEAVSDPVAGAVSGVTATISVGSGQVIIPADASAVLASVGICGAELYARFATDAAALATSTANAAQSGAAADREAARAAWVTAMDTWQEAELLRVGPAGPATLPEGANVRDEIYSWPLVSRCLVESTIVSQAYVEADFRDRSLINVRTLAALEYLLFYEGTDNACSATSVINSSGSWAALSSAELSVRKLRYAAVVAADVETKARGLATAWAADGDDFGGKLARAGAKGSPFDSPHAALNAVSDGLFYVEKQVKDEKLGRPLGILDCDQASCPDAIESKYAKRSVRHVAANLRGLSRFFAGCAASSDVGFDDLLAAAGAAELGLAMQTNVLGAVSTAESITEDDLAVLLATDRATADGLHAAVKRVTDDLKTDMITVLDLEAPAIVEGDND
jgi:predicted lipoprotein